MKNVLCLLLTTITLLIFMGCKQPKHISDKNVLSVSIEPQKYLLESIVGDKFEVNTAIPSGSNPESYDPSPSQMVNIGKSKMYFKVGEMGFENTWLHNISVNNKEMKIIDCSAGISYISDGGHHGADPHIWSSPKTTSIVAKNMYNAVVEYDSKNRDYYLDHYKNLERTIQKTDSIIRSYLEESSSKAFIIYHPALSYFANEYALTQYSIEVDGKSPSPKQLGELIEKAKKDSVKVVFLQEEYDERNAEVIAKELNADIVRINPLSYHWSEELIKIAKAIAGKDGE